VQFFLLLLLLSRPFDECVSVLDFAVLDVASSLSRNALGKPW